jgi:soluble lytic murein transglycosylase-like protein
MAEPTRKSSRVPIGRPAGRKLACGGRSADNGPMKRRTRLRRRLRRFWRRRLRRPLGYAAVALLAGVLALNLAVRLAGRGEVFLLSPRFLPQKATALGLLLRHRLAGAEPPADAAAAVRAAARRHGVPERLALAVARVESDLEPIRISRAGAMGLMQLMPATARALAVDDPFDARQSADGGTRLLARLLARYRGDWRRAAAAYNAGPGRVPRSGPLELPAETRSYVARVLAAALEGGLEGG